MLTWRSIRKLALERFLPGNAALIGSALIVRVISSPSTVHWSLLALQAILLGTPMLGYIAVLRLSGRRLPREVTTRPGRSTWAGVLASGVLALESVFAQGATLPAAAILGLAAGVISGLAVWQPWRSRPQPTLPDLDALAEDARATLAQLEALPAGPAFGTTTAPQREDRTKALRLIA